MRDAVCQLFGWGPGSEEWLRFIEAPQGRDIPRLAEHLGLAESQIPQDWNELISRLAHPGPAVFDFHADQKSTSCMFMTSGGYCIIWPAVDGLPARPEDRPLWSYGWPLGPEPMARGPLLGAVLIGTARGDGQYGTSWTCSSCAKRKYL